MNYPPPPPPPSTAGLTITEMRLMDRTAELLSPKELLYRDAFVHEYLKDFNGKQSMLRLGYANPKYASQMAKDLLKEPYVQQKLDEVVRKLTWTDVVTRQQVMTLMWKEANNPFNEGGVRVAALAHIAKMLGMFQGKTGGEENQQPVGVMLIPVMAVTDWEHSARTAQEMLRNSSGSPVIDIPGKEE